MPVLKRATRHIQAKGIDLQVIRGCYGPYLYDPKFRKQTGKVYGSVELAINAAIAGERPVNTEEPAPPACPWCEASHAPGKCPTAAAMTGRPLIAGLRSELEQAHAKLDKQDQTIAELHEAMNELHIRLAEYRSVNALATATLERYADKFGPLS